MRLPHDMLCLQRRDVLLFRPMEDVALVMDEYAGRVTVVMSSGEAAHRPGPAREVAGGSLVELRPGVFANPRHALRSRRGRGALEFPGGWSFSGVSPLPAPGPAAPAPDPALTARPRGGGRPCVVSASSIVYVERRGSLYGLRTVAGDVPLEGRPRELLAAHPCLAPMGVFHVNVRRLREISCDGRRYTIGFDTGDTVTISVQAGPEAARALGLPDLRRLDPEGGVAGILYDEGLRDWPRPILEMPDELIRPTLGADRRTAIANVLWQAVRLRSQGTPPDYGREHRGFWYVPLFTVLNRLGLAAPVPTAMTAVEAWGGFEGPAGAARQSLPMPVYGLLSASDAAYLQYQRVLADLVGRHRLFTYGELGFDDPRPDLRGIGAARPDVVLIVEKFSLLQAAREAARRFGVSYVVLGGESTWIAVEFFAGALRKALEAGRRVKVAAFVDFDPSGWLIADTFSSQLARYGVETESLCHLVLPKRFTAAQIKAVAYPLAAPTESTRTLVRRWIRRSGGVGTRGLGIHADHLRPLDRVIAAFSEETGLKEVFS